MRRTLVRLLCFALFLLSFCSEAMAQNCGQRDTIIFTANTTASIDLQISDYFNDDLSDPLQGLCAIELGFVHQFVENFELSLTSPGGQTVNLLGPNSDDPLAFTPGTQWNITLVNCASTAEPDSAFTAQWDNEQTENWVPFGAYNGSYYPFGGCLEDFNTGPVNGTWTFNITNDPSNNPGAITYIRLIFCDSRGVECCFAVASEWQNEDIRACVNADTLLIDPLINFPLGPADTTEYGYAYLIGESGIYQELDSLLDFRNAPPGEYEICGFSYRRSQIDSLPLADGMLTLDSIRTNLTGLEPWLCAELTPECLSVIIQAPPDTTRLTERICRGESIVVGPQSFEDTGFYTVDLLSEVGCDSIVTLDVFVQEVQFVNLDSTICPGDTVFVGPTPYFETGVYQDTLPTIELGCDSIVTLNLIVLSEQLTSLEPVICVGESFQVGDSTLTNTGLYQILLTSQAGCDSLVTVDLLVLDPIANITGLDSINCAIPETVLSASTSVPFPDLSFQWLDPDEMLLGSGPSFTASAAGSYILVATQELSGTTCTNRDTLEVIANFDTPFADPGLPPLITCIDDTVTIGGPGTSIGPAYIYDWQTSNGNITGATNGPFTQVTTAGQYQLIVTDTFSFCRDTATIDVMADQLAPIVSTGPGFTLNCLVTADTLDGTASFQPGFTLDWSGPCITTEPATGLAIVDCPGWYLLTVTNTATGCQSVDSVFVDQDLSPAFADIAAPDTLTCDNDIISLSGSASTPVGNLSFDWTGPSGPAGSTEDIMITDGGTYQLIVTRLDNFCRDTATILVEQDTISPIADIGPGGILTCAEPTLTLGSPNTSSGPEYTYAWCQNGLPVVGATTDTLLINAAASYVLKVTDTSNGCSTQDTIMISEDFVPPEEVEAGPNQLLQCGGDIIFLIPDSTIFSRPVSWEWTADCISPYSDTWVLPTDCPDLYTLTVTNLDNGCQGSDTVRVNVVPNFSQAVLPDSVFLSCEDGTATIDNTGSIGTLFSWFRDGISISLPNNSPVVAQPGTYTLIASDLAMSCSDTAQVEVLFDCLPIAIIAEPDTITCAQQSVTLFSTGSQTVGPNTYRWEGPDASCFVSPTNQPTAEVVCPGDYQLIIEHSIFGQADTTMVTVLIDTIAPQVDAGENVQITCSDPVADLTATILNNTGDLTFAWTNFFPGDTLAESINYTTSTAGTYRFFARNSRNGCIGSDLVQVTLDNSPPTIAFGSSVYPCEADSFLLQGFVSPDANYQYTWSGPAILATTDSADVWITAPGLYILEAINLGTACSAIDSVLVTEQTCIPCLELPSADTLDCQTNAVILEVNFCRPCIDCTLQWSDQSGPLVGEENLSLSVMMPGTYTLTATDTLGFSSSVTAEVILLDDPPLLDLGPDQLLTCDSLSVTLSNTLVNDPDLVLTYEWSELSGGTLPETGPSLVVSTEGTYILLLTNELTGCFARDTLVVTTDQEPPIAEAGPDQFLTCLSNVVVLDGSGSTQGGVTFSWTGPNEACLTGANTNNPLATCAGLYTLVVTDNSNGCSAQDTVRVGLNEDVPVLQAFPDTVLTCANPEILLTSMPPDTGDFTIRWCPLDMDGNEITSECANGQTDTLINLPGQYQFTVIDNATGCSNSFVVSVGIDTIPPIIDAGPDDTLGCDASSLQLNAQVPDGVSLSWTGPVGATILDGTTSTPTVDAIGWYILEATSSSNGCVARDSVQVLEDANTPLLEAGPDTLINCFNPSIRLNANGTTFSGAPQWQWQTSNGDILMDADQPNPLIGAVGEYIVTLTDMGNGCSIMDTVLVNANFDSPIASLVNPDPLLITCAQDTLLLDGSTSTSSTGAPLSYLWVAIPPGNLFPDLSSPTVSTDRPGDYQLIVIDQENGCQDTLSFTVESDIAAPDLEMAQPDTLDCDDMMVTLSTIVPSLPDGFSFVWTDANANVISNGPTAEASNPGWYYLTLTNDANGCTRTDSVFVEIDEELPFINIADPEPLTCEQTVVLLDASGSEQGAGINYQWTSPNGALLGSGTSLLDSTSQAGTYVLTIINEDTGCSSQANVSVEQEGQPILGLEVALAPPPCTGSPFGSISIDGVLGGTPPYIYQLDELGAGPISFFEDLVPGNYTLTVTDANGCSRTEVTTLLDPLPLEVDLGPDLELNLGDSTQLKPQTNRPVISWQWIAPEVEPNAPLEPFVTPTESQFIVLTVFDDNNCAASDTIRILVDKDRDLFIPTAFSPDGNGENDRFVIYGGDEVVMVNSLRIFSRWGNMVWEATEFLPNDPNFGWDGTLWGEPLNAAVFVYYAEVLFSDGKTELITGDVLLMR